MSKRKQAAIKAAKQAEATQQEQKANTKSLNKTSLFQQLKSPAVLASVGIGLLLSLGVIGATVGNDKNNAWLGSFSAPSSGAQPASANAPAVSPLPTPAPSPQLSKEYLYAGSRLLAVEDANAPASSNQPADLVVWRLTGGTGYWYIRDSTDGTFSSGVFGATNDTPVPTDFDGDGLADFCVFRPNDPSAGLATWYVQPSSGGSFYGAQFGLNSDKPAPADYDGDGRSDVAVWRNSAASFYILRSNTSTVQTVAVGQTGDVPISADYDGDGQADPAVYRTGSSVTWIIKQSSLNNLERNEAYGATGDEPVGGDFNGDGKFDLAVRRNSSNQWLYRSIPNGTSTTIALAMQSADKQVAGDYDGDGKTDAAVWRPSNGTWYIQQSLSGTLRTDQWGVDGDTPVPAPFRR